MRRFDNVDILATLAAVVERNTKGYKTDFEYDRESIIKAAADPDARGPLLWLSRTNGTELHDEREAFISGSEAYHTWTYYTHDNIRAFAVEIKGMENGKPVGTLYELDYLPHVEHVKKVALPVDAVSLIFADGSTRQFSYENEYKGNWRRLQNQYGRVHDCRFEVKDETALQSLLKQEREARCRFPARSVSAYIKGLPAPAKPSVTDKLAAARAEAARQAAPKKSAPHKSKEAEL